MNEPFDNIAQRLLDYGQTFWYSAWTCNNRKWADYWIPANYLMLHSIELLLKAMIYMQKENSEVVRGHNLSKLLNDFESFGGKFALNISEKAIFDRWAAYHSDDGGIRYPKEGVEYYTSDFTILSKISKKMAEWLREKGLIKLEFKTEEII